MKMKEEKMKPIQLGKHYLNIILNPSDFMFFITNCGSSSDEYDQES